MPEIREFMKQFYILDDWVRQFLIVGEEEALLIDTGVEESHVAEAVRQITSLPVRVVLTHGDHDHAGGLGAFGSCLVHPEDADMLPPEIRWQPLREGDTLECGGYRFEVLHIPGHTPGSIALLDREHGLLLPGDSIQKGGHDLYVRPQTEPGAVPGEPAGAAASGGGDSADPAQPWGVSH